MSGPSSEPEIDPTPEAPRDVGPTSNDSARPPAPRTRGFLFADLRGYTAYVESHGDTAAMGLLASYRSLVRGIVGNHEGAEIRTEGDSFYVVFPSASSAIRCGMEILDAARKQAAGGEQELHIGIGVHAGETAESDEEGLVGSAVNIAARICALAAPGELLVTETVRSLTRTFLPVRFVPRGSRRLKGVSELITVFRVEEATAAAAPAPRRAVILRRRTAAAIGAAGSIVAALAIAAFAIGLVRLPGSAPSSSGVPSRSPGVAAFPNPDERALIERLPSAVTGGPSGPNCREPNQSDRATDATVSIVCTPPTASGVASVWYDVIGDSGTLTMYFTGPQPKGDCAKDTNVQGTWDVPNPVPPGVPFLAGRLRCFQKGTSSWMWWTYDLDRIVARAIRNDANWKALWQWWDVVGPALKET